MIVDEDINALKGIIKDVEILSIIDLVRWTWYSQIIGMKRGSTVARKDKMEDFCNQCLLRDK